MQNSQLNRVINLVKRTGDKTVIMDNESDSTMMLMDLGAYEKMLDQPRGVDVKQLTEEELLEKINRDVAVWRAYNDKEQIERFDESVPNFEESPAVREKLAEVKQTPNVFPEAPVVMVKTNDIKMNQEESASDIVAEEEEEKFYLEPVE